MKKILVVDDEEELLHLVQKVLVKTGEYEVLMTSLPEEVLTLCEAERPDLLLLDIVMPQMDGNEIISRIKSNPSLNSMIIVVSSGMGEMVYFEKKDQWKWQPNRDIVQDRGKVVHEHSAERAAAAYGVDDFIAKPFSPATLVHALKEIFQRVEKEGRKRNGNEQNGEETV